MSSFYNKNGNNLRCSLSDGTTNNSAASIFPRAHLPIAPMFTQQIKICLIKYLVALV